MLMSKTCLKKLRFYSIYIYNTPFITYPGAIDCLKNLSKLYCCSKLNSELFYQLSQICQHIQLLHITVNDVIFNGLTDLISVQQNLKYLNIFNTVCKNLTEIISSLTKLPNNLNTIIKICRPFLKIYKSNICIIYYIFRKLRLIFTWIFFY